MATEVVLPRLGLTMTEGRIIRWLKHEGEPVTKGDLLFEVETDKALMEVEAPASGILGKVLVGTGLTLPIGQTIAWIVEPGEAVPSSAGSSTAPAPAVAHGTPRAQSPVQSAGTAPAAVGDVRASPIARRIAQERGIDLATVKGTGPGGRITQEDVERAIPASAPFQEEFTELSRIRKLTAERMAQSFQTVPHFYLGLEVDAGELVALHKRLAAGGEAEGASSFRLTDLFVAAVARALVEHPLARASWAEGKLRMNKDIHIGLATATDSGLIVPVICDADRLSADELARARSELVQKAKVGRLSPDDLAGATFTISNLGMYGVDEVRPIINPPQCAVLGIGQIREICVPFQGHPAIRPAVHLELGVDHRVMDGDTAARFLRCVGDFVENPATLGPSFESAKLQ